MKKLLPDGKDVLASPHNFDLRTYYRTVGFIIKSLLYDGTMHESVDPAKSQLPNNDRINYLNQAYDIAQTFGLDCLTQTIETWIARESDQSMNIDMEAVDTVDGQERLEISMAPSSQSTDISFPNQSSSTEANSQDDEEDRKGKVFKDVKCQSPDLVAERIETCVPSISNDSPNQQEFKVVTIKGEPIDADEYDSVKKTLLKDQVST